jgi:RNA polymerase sigma factor (TIGR02999 family)
VGDVTRILEAAQQRDPTAADQLLPLVYDELRRLAAHRLANEAAGQTLQPTALVHEPWLRLVGDENKRWEGRAHFFGAAAEAMRRISIDRTCRKQAIRHGGGQQRVDFQEVDLAEARNDDQLLAVSEALDKLAGAHKEEAELVKLRYFVGLPTMKPRKCLAFHPARRSPIGLTPGSGSSTKSGNRIEPNDFPLKRQLGSTTNHTAQRSRNQVAQTSTSAVSRVSKPAGCASCQRGSKVATPADLEIGDTARLETCATQGAVPLENFLVKNKDFFL